MKKDFEGFGWYRCRLILLRCLHCSHLPSISVLLLFHMLHRNKKLSLNVTTTECKVYKF